MTVVSLKTNKNGSEILQVVQWYSVKWHQMDKSIST